MKILDIKYNKFLLITGLIILLTISYFIYSEFISEKVVVNFLVAASNENCQTIQPLLPYSLPNHDVLCPRGDVGNFMVIDKVNYTAKNVIGSKFSGTKQVLVSVCIEARGMAAWNQGSYNDCTTDPRIIIFKRSAFSWKTDIDQFTNISKMIKQSGSEPANYRENQNRCFKTSLMDIVNGGNGLNCNGNVVDSDIEYAIKTHKFVEAGKAH